MDSTRIEELVTENMKAIFGFAMTRLANVREAECLASDILYELLKSLPNLKDENRFYGFMWKIAENTYKGYLRKRIRNSAKTAELDENIADNSNPVIDVMINDEEINLLRRELSLLSKQYRDTTVLYYMENLSCSDISDKLNISIEMVKYYLFRARKIIREGMSMERLYGEKSYSPSVLEIDFWGTKAGNGSEYQEFLKRKIKGNILLAAYYSPVTIQEISVELGVSLPYLEDEIKLLTDKKYLLCNNGKYLTNMPIFTVDCTNAINEKLKELTEMTAKKFMAAADNFFEKHRDKFANENIMRWHKVLMCLHFSLIATEGDLAKAYGELPSDGPYSFVNGGSGIIWGKSKKISDDADCVEIKGIYNGCPSKDGKGCVIAMNFKQVLNAQCFSVLMTESIVGMAVNGVAGEWQARLEELGYIYCGKPNYPVYTMDEYNEMSKDLQECIEVISDLNRKTSEIAAAVTADLAPLHIRKTAEYVGAFVYRFNAIENLVDALYDMKWLEPVRNIDKPAVCVVKF